MVMRVLGVAVCAWMLCGWGGQAQSGTTPQVQFIYPTEQAILQGGVTMVVEGVNFQDLKTFGYADFFYEAVGKPRVHLGTDQNTFDGLSLVWDTRALPDGEYRLSASLTDLFNNKGAGSVSVFINNLGNQSFTAQVAQHLLSSLEAMSRALDFPENLDVSKAIGIIQANLENAVVTINIAVAETRAILAAAPSVLVSTDPFLKIAPMLEQLARAINAAETSIASLSLSSAQSALAQLVQAVRDLSRVAPNGVNFAPLENVAVGIEQAAAQLDQLLAALQGKTGQSVEQAINTFTELARGVIPHLQQVAASLVQSIEGLAIRFKNAQGQVAVHFDLAERARIIEVTGNPTSGTIELFNAKGQAVLQGPLDGPRFVWDGSGQGGAPLGAGDYFFILTLQEGAGRTESGRVVVLP